jgi:superfamily II DNA or RNA helicase
MMGSNAMDDREYTLYKKLEGHRFEHVALSFAKTYFRDDPLPPIRADSLPKSYQRLLYGIGKQKDHEHSLDSVNTSNQEQITYTEGRDIIRFVKSNTETEIAHNGMYLTQVCWDAKTNTKTLNKSSTSLHFYKYWKENNCWGDVKPHYGFAIPKINENDMMDPQYDDVRRRILNTTTIPLHIEDSFCRLMEVPFKFKPPNEVLPRPDTDTPKTSDLSSLRPWVQRAATTMKEMFKDICKQESNAGGGNAIMVTSPIGSGKSSLVASLCITASRTILTSFVACPLIRLGHDFAKKYNDNSSKPHFKAVNCECDNIYELESIRSKLETREVLPNYVICHKTLHDDVDTITSLAESSENFIIVYVDEAHTINNGATVEKLINCKYIIVVFVTATPPDWKFKHKLINMKKVVGLTLKENIDYGYVLPFKFTLVSPVEQMSDDDSCLKYLCKESDAKNVIILVPLIKTSNYVKRYLDDMNDGSMIIEELNSTTKKRDSVVKRYTKESQDNLVSKNKMVILIAINMLDVGADYPATDTVLHLRNTKSHTNITDAGRNMQRNRQTRCCPGKHTCNFIMIDRPETRETLAQFLEEYDDQIEFTSIYKFDWNLETKYEHFVSQCTPNRTIEYEIRQKIRNIRDTRAKNLRDDELIIYAFLDEFQDRFPQNGDEFTCTIGDTCHMNLKAITWKNKAVDMYRARLCSEELMTKMESHKIFQIEVMYPPAIESLNKPTKPENYEEMLLDTTIINRRLESEEFDEFWKKVRKQTKKTKEIDMLLGDGTEYTFNLPHQKEAKTVDIESTRNGIWLKSNLYEIYREVNDKVGGNTSNKGVLQNMVGIMIFWQLYILSEKNSNIQYNKKWLENRQQQVESSNYQEKTYDKMKDDFNKRKKCDNDILDSFFSRKIKKMEQ